MKNGYSSAKAKRMEVEKNLLLDKIMDIYNKMEDDYEDSRMSLEVKLERIMSTAYELRMLVKTYKD